MRLFSLFKNRIQKKELTEEQNNQADCPSFNDEPWKSKADRLRPKRLDNYLDHSDERKFAKYKPLPPNHRYVRLVLKFLDTVPNECWIDEENEID